MPKFEKIKLSISFTLFVFFFVGCANIQSPSGGPQDKIPPRIIESYPTDKTLNYADNHITLTFSEWVNRDGVLQNISISPPINYTLHWNGKRLNIKFNENLKPNTTYSFMLGTDYSDMKSNKPDSAFSITFSTGNKIDSGIIAGKIIGKDVVNTSIYAYKIDAIDPDTLNPEQTKAEYSTQVGNNGLFTLRALPDGLYRVLAVKTNLRDNLFHPQQDLFGTTHSDVQVLNGHSFPQTIKIDKYPNLQKADIIKISQIDSNLINIEFTKQIQSSKFAQSKFEIIDTITNNIIPLQAIWLDSIISNKMSILTQNPLQFNYTYKFKIIDSSVSDIYGISLFGIEKDFYTSKPPFNFVPKLVNLPFKDSTRNIGLEKEYNFIFNYPVILDSSRNPIELLQLPDSAKVKIHIEPMSANILSVKLNNPLNADTWYRFRLNLKDFNTIGNPKFRDTVINLSFKTADWRSNPSISGHITVGMKCSNVYVVLKNSKDEDSRIIKADSLGNWQIDYVQPDIYLVEIFCDENANGKYDYGLAYPYHYSELFEIYDQKIEVKPRWNIEKINLTFPTHFQFIK